MVLSTLLNPSLLIADEVTSALDVSSQRAVAEMLVEFRERSFVKSVVFITHDLAVLYQTADTILVMYAGRLAEKAAADVVIDHPGIPTRSFWCRRCPRSACATRTGASRASPGGRRPSSTRRRGCRFRDRCPLAFAKCSEQPPFVEIEPGHRVACWAVS